MKLIIEDDEGHKTTVPFVREEITVGRQEGNTIRLTERNVSRRHARFFRQNGSVFVEDLKSYNGIKVNGDPIAGAVSLKDGDLIQIGDYDLAVQVDSGVHAGGGAPPVLSRDARETVRTAAIPPADPFRAVVGEAPSPVEPDPNKPAVPASRRDATAVIRIDRMAERPAPRPARDVPAAQAPRLVLVSTELAGREYACIRTELTIGRGEECDVSIDHRSLSRVHCKVVQDGSGGWRVVDLGSANKVLVNGEEYAETTLRPGDVIALGHVKLRFFGPGDDSPPEDADAALAFKRPRGLLIGAGSGAVVLAALGVYFAFLRAPTPSQEAAATRPPPQAVAAPKQPAAAPAPTPPAPAPEPEVELPDTGAAALANKGKGELRKGQLAAAARDLAQAQAGGADVGDALDRANAELSSASGYAEAERRFTARDWQGTLDALKGVSPHTAAAVKAKPLEDRAIAKLKQEQAQEARRADKPSKPQRARAEASAASAPAAPATEDAAKKKLDLRTQAEGLMVEGRFPEAIALLRRLLKMDPEDASAHKLLGSCLASEGQMDEAADHYRAFVRLAPNDPQAAVIRATLKQYEASKGQ